MAHTPGPWDHAIINDGWDGVISREGIKICSLIYNEPDNARLIAAAPKLLKACKAAFDYVGEPHSDEAIRLFDILLNAIAKASPE